MALTKKELAALAMHELMKREQRVYEGRISEQRRLATLSDEELQRLVTAMPLADDTPTRLAAQKGNQS